MIIGLTFDTTAGGQLNSVHCAEIGMFALYRKRYFMSLEWLELTEKMLQTGLINQNNTRLENGVTLDVTSALIKLTIQEVGS